MNKDTKRTVVNGIMAAMVCIATITIQIPMPGTNGYINIGDSVVFISAMLFGPITGMIAGGIGSAIADILSGYAHWAVFTIIIKGLEGYLVGIMMKKYSTIIKSIFSTLIGTLIMVSGYFIFGIILKGNIIISALSIPANLIQGLVSMMIAIPITYSLRKVKYVKNF